MSGVEILGVLASTTQLAAYSIKIALHLDEIHAAVTSTSAQIKRHLRQIKELIAIAVLIEEHESLWSTAIHRQLQSTLVEAQNLHELLEKLAERNSQNVIWRYWSLLSGIVEKTVLTCLDNLEKEKSTLCICIGTVHTGLLLSIRERVDTFSSTNMPSNETSTVEPEPRTPTRKRAHRHHRRTSGHGVSICSLVWTVYCCLLSLIYTRLISV